MGYVANLLAAQAHASFTLEQGPIVLSLIAALWALPAVVLPTVVRRAMLAFGPWRVALWAAALTSIATLVGIFSPSLAPLLAMVLAQGVGRAFALPALDSLPGHLDRDVDEKAVSVWLGFATYAPMIVGTLAASLFFDAVGPRAAFAFSAVSYFLCTAAIVAVRFIGMPDGTSIADVRGAERDSLDDASAASEPQPGEANESASTTAAPVSAVLRDRPVAAVLAASFLVWITYGAFTAVEIVYVRDVLGVSMAAFAVLQVWHGVGMLLGVVLMFRVGKSR
ncbi:MFS transporter [Corynebacterium sp. NPDC060344]|uniref:MFS transporter n=1 Tax=Corynebacterium sp. NPDC060344 TaxID=3347101 RepID=UPI003652FE57